MWGGDVGGKVDGVYGEYGEYGEYINRFKCGWGVW